MEFASEMVIRASKEKARDRQVPIEYHPRGGESKLSSFRDGWRHLRFLLVHSPTHLFVIPGALMALAGALDRADGAVPDRPVRPCWDVHAMIAGALLMIVGTQVLALGLCAHAYGTHFMGEQDPGSTGCAGASGSSTGSMLGGAITLAGLASRGVILVIWADRGFGALSEERLAVLAATLVIVGYPDLLLVVPPLDHRAAARPLS